MLFLIFVARAELIFWQGVHWFHHFQFHTDNTLYLMQNIKISSEEKTAVLEFFNSGHPAAIVLKKVNLSLSALVSQIEKENTVVESGTCYSLF